MLLLLPCLAFVSGFGSGSPSPGAASVSVSGALAAVPAPAPPAPRPEWQPDPGDIVAEFPAVEVASLPLHEPPRPLPVELAPPSPLAIPALAKGTLAHGQSLGSALRAQGVPSGSVHVIAREMRPVFDFRHSQPGDRYRLALAPGGDVLDFRYETRPESALHLYREGDDYRVAQESIELEARITRTSGVIETSLYKALRELGEPSQLANHFADLFAWDVDFGREVRPGDEFHILYERLYRTDEDGVDEYVRPGRVLAARYRGEGGTHTVVYYAGSSEVGSYYRPDGGSVERQFLAAPLEFSRISSHYTASRRHPILNVTRPHHGIDYAAAEGAPIWSVADGVVIYRGWGGSFGNLIKIRHTNGYVSYYSHLSGFAKGLRVGQPVTQKQKIGYVGQTGLATGPHICFRVARNGRYVNPLDLRTPAGRPVADESWDDFQLVRDQLLRDLQPELLIATESTL